MPTARLAVFCASRSGHQSAWQDAAYEIGTLLATRDIGVVYGGGGSGSMGALAQGALDHGGEVIGVIPQDMIDREWGRHDLTRLEVVQSMHERKARMAAHADGFLCLPGGLGTLEEIFEVWTWRTLGYHHKPVGFLDLDGFWSPLLTMLRGIADGGLMSGQTLDELIVAAEHGAVVEAFAPRLGAG